MNGQDESALQAAAWAAHHHNDWPKAIALWDELAAAFPNSATAAWAGGWALREAKRLPESEARLHAALQNFPTDPNVITQFAWAAHQANNWSAAVERWAAAREKNPTDSTGWWAGGRALRETGNLSAAHPLLTEAVEKFPSMVWCWFELLETTLAQADAHAAFTTWQAMRTVIQPDLLPHLRSLTIRVLRLQTTPEILHELLLFLLEEDPLAIPHLPALWNYIKELLEREAQRAPGFDAIHHLRSSMAQLASTTPPPPFSTFCAALFRLNVNPAALLDDVRRIVTSPKPFLIGTLIQLNEPLGKLAVHALAYEAAINPATLPLTQLAAFLRIAVDSAPTGFEALLRRIRHLTQPAETGIDTPSGLIAAISQRYVLPEHMPGPALITMPDRPLRVALCISGQLRGYAQAFASWSALGLADHDVTTIVHSWRNLGRRQLDTPDYLRGRAFPPALHAAYSTAWHELGGLPGIKKRYPAFNALFRDAADASLDELRTTYQTDHIILEDDTAPPFAGYSNQEKMFYKIHAAQTFATSLGQNFDLCIRLRPDKQLSATDQIDWHNTLHQTRRQRLIFNDSGGHYVMSGHGAGDQFATAAPELMNDYASLWTLSQNGSASPFGAPAKLTGHNSLATHLFALGIKIRPIPGIAFGTFFDAAPIPLAQLTAALRQDIGVTPRDAVDAAFLRACDALNPIIYPVMPVTCHASESWHLRRP